MNSGEILNKFMQAGLVHLPDIYPDAIWTEYYEELSYNTGGNEEDLENGNGETYSGTIRSKDELDGYVIFEVDSGCGWDYQVILAKKNKVED